MTNTSPAKKINFDLNGGANNVLILDGSDNMVKLPSETKLASDDNTLSYVNATNSGAQLNVMGESKVFVRGGDAAAG